MQNILFEFEVWLGTLFGQKRCSFTSAGVAEAVVVVNSCVKLCDEQMGKEPRKQASSFLTARTLCNYRLSAGGRPPDIPLRAPRGNVTQCQHTGNAYRYIHIKSTWNCGFRLSQSRGARFTLTPALNRLCRTDLTCKRLGIYEVLLLPSETFLQFACKWSRRRNQVSDERFVRVHWNSSCWTVWSVQHAQLETKPDVWMRVESIRRMFRVWRPQSRAHMYFTSRSAGR